MPVTRGGGAVLPGEQWAHTAPEESRLVKLFVNGVPDWCGETEVRSLFSRFGQVVEVVLLSRKNSAFVKYASLREAEAAIGSLNGRYKMPSGLKWLLVKIADHSGGQARMS